jgi:ATP-dependent helicase/nuclease subunit A
MSDAPFAVDDTTRAAQLTASDPERSAWVSANAGSGKTYVLAQRVIRLLLSGVDPGRILCLTFTKAAAAEMSKRVFGDLAKWTQLDDTELATEIARIEDDVPPADLLARARRLFARALETPGGLKIQTIHAFCERLLHQFPFEANVAGHFEVLDDQQSAGLIAEARQNVLAHAVSDPESPLGKALKVIISGTSDSGYEQAVTEFVERRDDIHAWIAKADSLPKAVAELRSAMGLSAADNVEALTAQVLDGSLLSEGDLRGVADALSASTTDRDAAVVRAIGLMLGTNDDEARRRAYLPIFLTTQSEPRKRDSFVSAAMRRGGFEDALLAEYDRLIALLDRLSTADTYEASAAMLQLADAVIQEYETRKARAGFLDFRDLVVKTGNLLLRRDAAQWVHYKLDQGLDHILVDEAQDTSPRQWDVVVKLAEEFFSGRGASDRVRTIFAVGDEKQSIYSFQGAVPARFSRVRDDFHARAEGAGLAFSRVELHVSFRSSPDVLSGVDAVFASVEAHAGLSSDAGPTVHSAARLNAPGHFVFWPMAEPPDKPTPGAWDEPLDHLGADSPEAQLAARIAKTVKGWIESRARLDKGQPIHAGGILILTRSRSALSDAINRALKECGVPIAGADRLQMGEHIAVLDLLALGDIMLLPEDDLTLAALLRSPLFDIGEDDLFHLAHGRVSTLWQALSVAKEPQFRNAFAQLERWRSQADFRAPHDFYARVLAADGGRRRFVARLGAETEDVLDEFLAQALAYERSETPSLQGFLHWSRTTATEVKREPALFRDEVRVMTVHGAKGLEADIVFLVDDGSAPTHGGHDPRVVALTDDPDAALPVPLVWYRGAKFLSTAIDPYIQSLRERRRDEYRRLLYVGLTRARDRLIMCGTAKRAGTDRAMGWHALVQRGLQPGWRPMADNTGEAFEWRGDWEPPQLDALEPARAEAPETPLPDWLGKPAPEAPGPLSRLSPSRALAETEKDERPFLARNALEARLDPQAAPALERGLAVHRLLQSLPELRANARRAAAGRYLDRVAAHWSAEERAATVDEVLAVMDHPHFAPVFGPGSRAEIEIAGRVPIAGGETAMGGRIDRIVVTLDRVLIVDFKTNRPAPSVLEEVPRDYLAQLAVYRRALVQLYADRPVAAALLWTDGPRLMEISDSALDSAYSLLFKSTALP